MKKLIYSMVMLLSTHAALMAQPAIEWQKNYGGNNGEFALSTKQTSDGGYIVAGYTLSNNGDVTGYRGGEDYWVMKLNSAGTIQWKRTYGGSGDDRCNAVLQTADGGYILAGTSNSADGQVTNAKGGFDMWIVKTDANGNITWRRNFGGSDDEAAYSIDELNAGGYVIAGESKSSTGDIDNNKGGYDYWIIKVSAAGNLVWERNYGGSADESAKSVQECTDGSIIVAGETVSNDYDVTNNKGGYDFWVLRLRANGTIRWKNTYGGTANDNAYAVTQISNGNFIVVGETESNNGNIANNAGGDDFFVMNLRGSGAVQWSKTYGGSADDNARFVRETADGAVVITGKTESNSGLVTNPKGAHDVWVIKVIKSNGNLDWQRTLGGSDNDFGYAVDVTADGAQVVVGHSESDDQDLNNNKGNADFWIVKLSSSGQRVIADAGQDVKVVLNLYPNPATTFVHVNTGDKVVEQVNIMSMDGRFKTTTVPSASAFQLDIADLPSGVYIVRVVLEGGAETTGKLVVE